MRVPGAVSAMIRGRATKVAAIAASLIGLVVWRPEPAIADDSGFYLGISAFGGSTNVRKISGTGIGGALVINHDDDLTAGGAGSLGYRFSELPLRAEVEVGYRFRQDIDARDVNGPASVGYENNLSSTTVLLGLAYEFRGESDWQPFVGAMVGWARNTSDVDRTVLANGAMTNVTNEDDNLAYGATVGIDYLINEHWDLGAAYRFLYLGGFDTGVMAAGDRFEADRITSHDLVVTVRYQF